MSRSFALAGVAAAILSTILGLLQYFDQAVLLGLWVNRASLGEAYANLRQRNQFATLTNIGLVALLWWVQTKLMGARHPHPSPLPKGEGMATAATMAAAMLLAAGNAASSSRTGLLQLFVLLAMVGVWRGWRQVAVLRPLLVAVVAYAAAAYFLPILAELDPNSHGMLARLRAGDGVCSSRLTLWRNVLQLIAQKPWFGWGWGELDYAHFITLYEGPRFCDILDNAHNLPLHLAVELGVPFAALVCGTGLWLVWRAKPWTQTNPDRQMAWAVLALIMLHSMLEYPLWYGPFQMAFGLCVWILWRGADDAKPKSRQYRYLFIVGWTSLASIFIACLAYAAWDYQRISQIYLHPEQRSPAYRDDTLAKIQGSWLFKNQVDFAELTITPLDASNAPRLHAMALDLLHFSPEARVVEIVIDSANLLGWKDETQFYVSRFKAAFPEDYARWLTRRAESGDGTEGFKAKL